MAVPAQVKKAIEHDNRRANDIRSRPLYRQERVKWDRIASEVVKKELRSQGTINDTIGEIERANADRRKGRPKGESFYSKCFFCGEHQARPFNRDGILLKRLHFTKTPDDPKVDEYAPVCHACGESPFGGSREVDTLNIMEFEPYYDVSLGRDARGAEYVPGKGHYIRSREHLREFARANGRDYR